ncbi:UNVERIFIED_CONTAM: hypothetical protein GTU68_039915 [Idotea baltica]|nr:hypothetical protein [Idotea baltica]
MSVGKSEKFQQLDTFKNVFQNNKEPFNQLYDCNDEVIDYKGKWRAEYFKNENPLVLELACGEGYYTIAMAQQNPNINLIGIDVKGNRIWQGAKNAIEAELPNVAFQRTLIESIDDFFAEGEVDEIWITFPDPFLKYRRMRKRLTYTRFLLIYQKILKKGGIVNLKTDSTELYEFSKEMLELHKCNVITDNNDIYGNGHDEPLLEIKTRYEGMHLKDNRTIKYLKFSFKDE